MKTIFLIGFLILVCTISKGQVNGGTNEKLKKLYEKEQYENCMFKAIDYSYHDKHRKNPEIYLYAAMSYYQLHRSEDPGILNDYPKALKEAMKYLLKFKRKDHEGTLSSQNEGNINTILNAYFEEAVALYTLQDYSQAGYQFKQLAKYYEPDNTDLLYLYGVCQALDQKSTAQRELEEIIPVLKEQKKAQQFSVKRPVKVVFTNSFIDYANMLLTMEQRDSAISTLHLGLEILPGNINIQSRLDSLGN